jgi:hypothetical protein
MYLTPHLTQETQACFESPQAHTRCNRSSGARHALIPFFFQVEWRGNDLLISIPWSVRDQAIDIAQTRSHSVQGRGSPTASQASRVCCEKKFNEWVRLSASPHSYWPESEFYHFSNNGRRRLAPFQRCALLLIDTWTLGNPYTVPGSCFYVFLKDWQRCLPAKTAAYAGISSVCPTAETPATVQVKEQQLHSITFTLTFTLTL